MKLKLSVLFCHDSLLVLLVKWAIVKFIDEYDMVEIVPTNWLTGNGKIKDCLWPPIVNTLKITKMIQDRLIPQTTWQMYRAVIVKGFGNRFTKIIMDFFTDMAFYIETYFEARKNINAA